QRDDTFEAVVRDYIADLRFQKKRSWEWYARLLGLAPNGMPEKLDIIRDGSKDQRGGRKRVSLVDRWGTHRIGDITDAGIIRPLDQIKAHAPIAANRLHAVLSAFFAWAKGKRRVTENPCTGLDRPAPEQSRDRVLTDAELRKVWVAAGELGHPWGGL